MGKVDNEMGKVDNRFSQVVLRSCGVSSLARDIVFMMVCALRNFCKNCVWENGKIFSQPSVYISLSVILRK